MPFGLTNAPSVFQQLMNRVHVLRGLTAEDDPDFVGVYLDEIFIISRTLDEHLKHLRAVLERIETARLKLHLSKCWFIRCEVEYLSHVATPAGLKTNPKIVSAMKDFLCLKNINEVCHFAGLASY